MLGPAALTDWRTPPELFSRWQRQFAFTVDAAAEAENAMISRYWTPLDDGLAQPWICERVWCNPPYGRSLVLPWVRKAARREADCAVLLLPVRPETAWWREFVAPHAIVRFLAGRVHFSGQKHSAPFASCLAIYYPPDNPIPTGGTDNAR